MNIRRIWLLVFLVAAVALSAQAQGEWVRQYSGKRITTLYVQSPQVIWAGGENSILVSTDGGGKWAPYYQEQGTVVHALVFLDPQNAWAVGTPGTVLHTTNGGRQWQRLEGVGQTDFRAVFFHNPNTGWLGGSEGRLLTTANAGQDWTSRNFRFGAAAEHVIRTILFPTETNGVILLDKNTVLITGDRGAQWRPLRFPESYVLESLVAQGQTLWLAGGRRLSDTTTVAALWRSDDFGRTWTPLSSVNRFFGVITSLWFADASTGFLAVEGQVHVTRDAGKTWTQVSDATVAIEKIFGIDADNLWGLSDGAVYRFSPTAPPAGSTPPPKPAPPAGGF